MKQLTLFPEPTPTLKASTSATESPFASAFDHFTLEQRKQIIAWNDNHAYEETIDLIQKEFGITVSPLRTQRRFNPAHACITSRNAPRYLMRVALASRRAKINSDNATSPAA